MILLAPSKGQDTLPGHNALPSTQPEFLDQARELVEIMRGYDLFSLRALMRISPALAERTLEQVQSFTLPFSPENAKPAILTFTGEVYRALNAVDCSKEDLLFAQEQARILSGLYGCLRPLDLIQPYRLEMGDKLPTAAGTGLYRFWGDRLTASLDQAARQTAYPILINLASAEYSKVIVRKRLTVPWLDIEFKEESNGSLRTVALYAKRARGLMAGFIIRTRIEHPADLQQFTGGGYTFRRALSNTERWVFTRAQT